MVALSFYQLESGERGSSTDGRSATCLNLEVIPFQPTIANVLYFLVIFEAVSPPVTPLTSTPVERQEPEDLEREIIQLRQALAASTQRELSAQAHLQAVIQEHNYLNQSLRVANEEILSSNEELQSTNEELQTAKEEIQATNEELSTTNEELRSRNLQQNRDNSDLNNFIDSISVPILMLTNDLRIRRFTPTAQRLFNFISADVGRPFNDFRTDFDASNLEAMALEVLETLNTKVQEIQIVAQLSSQTIVGDADRLQQVVSNLLSNAIKFTPNGGRVEICLSEEGMGHEARGTGQEESIAPRAARRSPLAAYAQITVNDTGQGISADLLPHIFDRFRQGDSSTTKAKPGLGLGLSIVRHLVELHGGTVQATSPGEGQGATFIVRLPLREPPPEPTPSGDLEPTACDRSSDPGLSLAGLQILAVDDEVDTCELLEFVLAQYGADVRVVASAREALAALKEDPRRFNVLISDIGMPEADGYWLIRQVRSLSGGQVPAIALTAYASEAERQRAIAAGFQRHIAKPVEPEKLVRAVLSLSTSSTEETG